MDPAYGARPLRRAIQRMVEDMITDMLLRRDVKAGDVVVVDAAAEGGLAVKQKCN